MIVPFRVLVWVQSQSESIKSSKKHGSRHPPRHYSITRYMRHAAISHIFSSHIAHRSSRAVIARSSRKVLRDRVHRQGTAWPSTRSCCYAPPAGALCEYIVHECLLFSSKAHSPFATAGHGRVVSTVLCPLLSSASATRSGLKAPTVGRPRCTMTVKATAHTAISVREPRGSLCSTTTSFPPNQRCVCRCSVPEGRGSLVICSSPPEGEEREAAHTPPQEGPKVQGNSPPEVGDGSPPSPTLWGEIRRVASVHSIEVRKGRQKPIDTVTKSAKVGKNIESMFLKHLPATGACRCRQPGAAY